MALKYLVIEIQTYEGGSITTPTYAFDNRLAAESKYHTLLGAAALSKLPCHAAVLLTSEGQVLDHGMYKHDGDADA